MSADVRAGKYLTFELAGEQYGIGVLKVQEIIRLTRVTRVPGAPGFVRGVINLRGKVTPVVDLRAKFGLEPVEPTPGACIVVVQVTRAEEQVVMGLVVDGVCDVVDFEAGAIEPAPAFGEGVDTAVVLGMGLLEDAVVVLLDIERVLSPEEFERVVVIR